MVSSAKYSESPQLSNFIKFFRGLEKNYDWSTGTKEKQLNKQAKKKKPHNKLKFAKNLKKVIKIPCFQTSYLMGKY